MMLCMLLMGSQRINTQFVNIFIDILSVKRMHSNTNMEDIHRALASKYLSTDLINEYQCMRSQAQVMQNIRQLMEKKSAVGGGNPNPNSSSHNHTMNMENLANIEASSISQVNYSNDDSLIKSKFTEEFEQSIVTAALNQVKNKCSDDTYETVRQYIQNNKIKEAENIQKRLERIKEEKEDLASQLVILKLEKSNAEKELEKCRKIVNSVQEEKNSIKKRVDYVLKKQNQIYKLQTSFAFKEKINLELKKRYERLRQATLSNQQSIREMLGELDQLWTLICNKMDSVDCPSNCWKKDAMKRAREQLLEERKLLKQESDHIEKEYQIMNIVSSQFKKIFHEPERNPENGEAKQRAQESKSSSSRSGSMITDGANVEKQNMISKKIATKQQGITIERQHEKSSDVKKKQENKLLLNKNSPKKPQQQSQNQVQTQPLIFSDRVTDNQEPNAQEDKKVEGA